MNHRQKIRWEVQPGFGELGDRYLIGKSSHPPNSDFLIIVIIVSDRKIIHLIIVDKLLIIVDQLLTIVDTC